MFIVAIIIRLILGYLLIKNKLNKAIRNKGISTIFTKIPNALWYAKILITTINIAHSSIFIKTIFFNLSFISYSFLFC